MKDFLISSKGNTILGIVLVIIIFIVMGLIGLGFGGILQGAIAGAIGFGLAAVIKSALIKGESAKKDDDGSASD